jgi:hypothetical protein
VDLDAPQYLPLLGVVLMEGGEGLKIKDFSKAA